MGLENLANEDLTIPALMIIAGGSLFLYGLMRVTCKILDYYKGMEKEERELFELSSHQ